jgi:hypothetical protein
MSTKEILWLLLEDAFDIEQARAMDEMDSEEAHAQTDALCANYAGRLLD